MSAADQETKEMVVHFYDQLFSHGNVDVIDKFVRSDYLQHNPHAPNGPEALRGFVTGFKAAYPDMRHSVERVIAEGDLVLLHSKAVLKPGTQGQAIVDIFRITDGMIAEHWDVIQPVPDGTASGNDLFSTLSTPHVGSPDPGVSAAASKQVAVALFREVTADKDVSAFDRYVAGPYYQHNPQSANGPLAAKAFFASTFARNPGFRVSIKRVIAEGDYVALHSHYQFAADDVGVAVVDLFRVRDGKVVEHWDVIQPVPAHSANDNTMF